MRMKNALVKKVTTLQNQLQKINSRPFFTQPFDRVNQQRQTLDNLIKNLVRENQSIIKDKKSQFGILAGKLDALSPLKIMERGYSVVKNSQGNVVNSVGQVNVGDNVKILLNNGLAECDVKSVREGKIYE